MRKKSLKDYVSSWDWSNYLSISKILLLSQNAVQKLSPPWSITSALEGLSHLPLYSLRIELKHLPGIWETWVRSLGGEDPLEKEMATHSSTLAWRIPWREEPGGLQPTGSQRVGHGWETSLHFTSLLSQWCWAWHPDQGPSNMSITWKLVRNANSQSLHRGRNSGGGIQQSFCSQVLQVFPVPTKTWELWLSQLLQHFISVLLQLATIAPLALQGCRYVCLVIVFFILNSSYC